MGGGGQNFYPLEIFFKLKIARLALKIARLPLTILSPKLNPISKTVGPSRTPWLILSKMFRFVVNLLYIVVQINFSLYD